MNPCRGIQYTTRGGYQFIEYKMDRFAQKHGIENINWPFWYLEYVKPKRHRWERWERTLKILQALESMRNQSIFFGKIWNSATIRDVERGTNEYLQRLLMELMLYWYPFDGVPVDMSKLYPGAWMIEGHSLPPEE